MATVHRRRGGVLRIKPANIQRRVSVLTCRRGADQAWTVSDLYYDPYDHEIDVDPYPIWKRLRMRRRSITTRNTTFLP